MKFIASFVGRKVNAEGVRFPVVVSVVADTEEEAKAKVHEHFEHVMKLTVTEQVDGIGDTTILPILT